MLVGFFLVIEEEEFDPDPQNWQIPQVVSNFEVNILLHPTEAKWVIVPGPQRDT